jgi:amino acid adenylation domain-containing protein
MSTPMQERTTYPLSHAQQRMWYVEKTSIGSSVHNVANMVRFKDYKMDRDLLAKAINMVIYKNEGLRLRLLEQAGEPTPQNPGVVQYISDYREIKIDYFDPGSGGDGEVERWVEMKVRQPFTLIDHDLFYFAIIRYNEREIGYLLKGHHIIVDAWTAALLINEINTIYRRLKEGETIDLSPNPSYIDYIADEQAYLRSPQARQDRGFWHEELSPLPEEVNLSYKKAVIGDFKARKRVMVIPPRLRQDMIEYSCLAGTSRFKLILSAFSILIARMSAEDDFVICTYNHGRPTEAHKKMAGMFVSTLPLRVRIDSDQDFNTLVREAGEKVNRIVKHYQRYPFDMLNRELREKSGRDVSYLLNLNLVGHPDISDADTKIEHIFPGDRASPLYLHINYSGKDAQGILEIEWNYQAAVYTEGEINSMHRFLENILSQCLRQPDIKISEIQMISEQERNRILYEFNQTETDYPADRTIPELFARQLDRAPDRGAVVYRDHQVTYKKLAEVSHRLAHLLTQKGGGEETVIGIMLERSIEMMVGILGILKVGGAYLPIDPRYPEERVRYMLADSGASIVLSDQRDRVPSTTCIRVQDTENMIREKEFNRARESSPSSLAYVIYTSGTTGRPKGVMVGQRSVVNLLRALNEAYPILIEDRYLFKTPSLFDVSVTELFGWFLGGGSLVILPEDEQRDPYKIIDAVAIYNITHINFVPSMFNGFLQILNRQNIDKLSPLKYIFLAGESLMPELVKGFHRLGANIQLENLYGPTEATVYASRYSISNWKEEESVPIGKPIRNVKSYILGKYDDLQPINARGELCISGAGVARGYLNNPELTWARFSPDPFGRGEFMYRTGDLVRWLEDGNIEFFGRMDQQVKIRGYRVELEEIESRLLECREIKEAVVMVRADRQGTEQYLCAYIIPLSTNRTSRTSKTSPLQLRQYLARTLPDYMVPSHFVVLERLPLTPSGKIDRKSLPPPETGDIPEAYTLPRDRIEEKLVEIWAEALGMEKGQIGVDRSFIELGGHSLKGIMVLSRIHREFNFTLSLAELFRLSTIERLANHLKKTLRERYLPIEVTEKREYYELSPTQKRLYVLHHLEREGTLYNIPSMFEVTEVDRPQLQAAIGVLIRRHESLRTSFVVMEGEPVQRVHEEVEFHIEYYDLAALKHFVRPFDLSRAPLLRVGLMDRGKGEAVLLIDMPHVVTDAISMEIFIRELSQVYERQKLPTLKLQYRDYANWQNRRIESGEIESQEAYWLEIFADDILPLRLPHDYPSPAIQDFAGQTIGFEIDTATAKALKEMVGREGVTMYVLFLTIYTIFLSKLSGQEDIVIGTPAVGRRHPDLHEIMGMFVNTLALRNFPSPEKTFLEFLHEVRDRVLSAFDNQDFQLEDLKEKVFRHGKGPRNTLFDVFFQFSNLFEQLASAQNVGKKGLKIRFSGYESRNAKFDLYLNGSEKGEKIVFKMEYSTNLFKEETIKSFIGYFKQIVAAVVDDNRIHLKEIAITHELRSTRSNILQQDQGDFGF